MYVIETELPDGFHWFGGIFTQKIESPKGIIEVPFNFWTPYEKEAVKFETAEQPIIVHKEMIKDNCANVVHVSKAKFQYAYIKIGKDYFLGPKRQYNLQVGDKFKTEVTANYFFEVTEIKDKTAICVKRGVFGPNKKKYTKREFQFSLKSNKFIYSIYSKQKTEDVVTKVN